MKREICVNDIEGRHIVNKLFVFAKTGRVIYCYSRVTPNIKIDPKLMVKPINILDNDIRAYNK